MDQLWAPWRLGYVTRPETPPPAGDKPCFLCVAAAGIVGRETLTVHQTHLSCVVLNRFPYSNGHLLVAPRTHKPTLEALDPDELMDLQLLLKQFTATLRQKLAAEGFNVGLNLGACAGAGLPGHLHWHIVPRWAGDVNFMPVFADTRVIVQSLDALFDLLTAPA